MDPADKATPCPLGDLPDELLGAIVSHLEIERGPLLMDWAEARRREENTLTLLGIHGLSLTCRKLNAIVTPILYQCIIFSRTPQRLLRLILRTLIGKPELSQYVQYFESPGCIRWSSGSHKLEEDYLDSFTESEMETYLDHLAYIRRRRDNSTDSTPFKPFTGYVEELWFCKLPRYRFQVAAFCLLAFAQKSTQAVVSATELDGPLIPCMIYYKNNGLRTLWVCQFGKHSTLLYRYDADTKSTDNPLAKFLYWLQQGRLEILTARVEMDALSLDAGALGIQTVEHALSPFIALKRFECRLRSGIILPLDVGRPFQGSIKLPAYRDALLRFHDSLETLAIDTTNATWNYNPDEEIPPFGSFCEFTALKHLTTSRLVLCGRCNDFDYAPLSAILPKSLETLNIKTEWTEDLDNDLTIFHEYLSIVPTQLKVVECSWDPAPKIAADRLMAAFQEIDVELILDVDEDTVDTVG